MAEWIARARGVRLALAGAGMIAGFGLVASAVTSPAAYAQQKKAAAKKDAPAQASQSAWVKLCEAAKYQKMGADGKPQFDKDKKPVLED
jgi:hypothetical protein